MLYWILFFRNISFRFILKFKISLRILVVSINNPIISILIYTNLVFALERAHRDAFLAVHVKKAL